MISPIEPAEFFVVGAPVSPERQCYVERAADRQIDDALRDKRACCVLGPPGVGKSSLLARTARSHDEAGALVVSVDLAAIAERRGESPDTGLELLAERVAAGLELGVDVAAWWNARSSPVEKRLVEFFWEIVLTNTAKPVMLLFDGVEAALPLAAAVLNASAFCRARRGREPDFGRLGFVFAGRATRRQLAAAGASPGIEAAVVVEPRDFTPTEAYRLASAFGGTRELAQALMDRICAWTGGHPHLTQRLARGIARTGGRLEDVERYVREQLLPFEAAERDPFLAHVRASLGEPSKAARRAASFLKKLAAGGKLVRPADPAVAERLWLSGAVRAEADGRLTVRNRILRELVLAGWLKTPRSASGWLAAAAVLLVALAAAGYWYVETLPSAALTVLADPAAELGAAEAAYRRLRGLPGFEQRADELWRAALERQSRAATTLDAAAAVDARLRALPDQDAAADRLMSEFWLRRARERMHSEQREAAILFAQRAAALPAADPAAGALLVELAGDDWSRLERTVRLAETPEFWHQAFARGELVSIDAARQALRTPFGAGSATPAAAARKLTAVSHSALARELVVDGEGTAGELELSLAVLHAAAGELLVTLTAPSGAAAVVTVPRSDGDSVETFLLQGASGSPLAALADEAVRGAWRLTVVDRAVGTTGLLGGWGLRFGEIVVRDDPPEPLAIPDPVRSEDVNVLAVGDRAVAWPAASGAIGSLAVWNLATGQLLHDLTFAAAPEHVALDPKGERVLAATSRLLMVWNVADGALAARVGTATQFVLTPRFSADGGYVAIAEGVDGASPLYSVLRSADGSLVSTIDGVPGVQGWELGPGGRYVALQGPETVVRVLETRRGAELRRLTHTQPVERLLHSNGGATLLTVDRAGDISAWTLAVASADEPGRPVGHTAAAASVSTSADGRRLAFTREDGAVSVVDVVAGVELYRLRIPRAVPVTATELSENGIELVTQSGRELRLWRLPLKPVTPRQPAETLPTALAVDAPSGLVAVGFASGQLRVAPAGDAERASLAFFGHRGAVSAAALNAAAAVAATGGVDGFVRVWQLASGAPTPALAPPADLPVALVALDDSGRYVASAAGRLARVAAVADGRVATQVQADGVVTALEFAPDGAAIAVGDATGAVVVAPLAAAATERVLSLGGRVTALAFARDGARLAIGDAGGAITLVVVASGEVERATRLSAEPVRWLEWSADGVALLAATDAWVHALDLALAPRSSKLVAWPAAHTALAAASSTAVAFAGTDLLGELESGVVDLAAPLDAPRPADVAALVARDWPAALGLRLGDDDGEPVPFDP
jgi:WD40 repeat protein